MSFQIQRNNEKKKSQTSNEDGSSPMSQIEDYEIDNDRIIFGDIVKSIERTKKKKPTISNLLKSSPKKVNPNDIIKLSLDKKKCTNLFEEDKLYEFSQRSLNPTQYRIQKKKLAQNGSPTPTPKKHSNKVMPEAFITMQNSNNPVTDMQNSVQQRSQNPLLSPLVAASIIQLQQQETHTTLLDKLSIDEFLSMAMQKKHLSHQIRKDLKVALKRNLIQPHHYREFFLIGTNAQVMMQQNRGYFQALLKQKNQYPSNYFDKIKQDVCRSFPQQQEEKQKFQDALENVLSAVAIRNPYIHYCQGMNYIGVFILKYITQANEEETFWILVQLLESVLSLEMYNNPEFFVYYINMLEEYFKLEFSELYEKLKKFQIQFLMYPFNEILTLFTNQIQPQITFQILMNLIVSGQRALFRSMIALINTCRQQLIKAENFNQINNVLQTFRQYNDKEEFMKEYNKFYINKRAFMMALNAYSEIQRQTRGSENKNLMLNQVIDKCNTDSPICLHIQHMIRILKRSFSFFVYKTQGIIQPTIVDYFSADKNQNYYDTLHNKLDEDSSPQQKIKQPLADYEKQIKSNNLDDLMVGRFYHMCDIIEQRQSGQMSGSLFSPQKNMTKSSFRSPQFLSVKKICDSDNETQLNLQDGSITIGTDPIPVFKNTSSILLSPNREKSKTHSSACSKDFNELPTDLSNTNNNNSNRSITLSNFGQKYNGEQEFQFGNYQDNDEDGDEDGNYTHMFGQNKESPENIIRPRRRKSINWEGTGSESQPKYDPISTQEGLGLEEQSQNQNQYQNQNLYDNLKDKQDSVDQSLSSNSPVRSRSQYMQINSDIHNMLMIQMAAASQKLTTGNIDTNKQRVLKF